MTRRSTGLDYSSSADWPTLFPTWARPRRCAAMGRAKIASEVDACSPDSTRSPASNIHAGCCQAAAVTAVLNTDDDAGHRHDPIVGPEHPLPQPVQPSRTTTGMRLLLMRGITRRDSNNRFLGRQSPTSS